MAMPCVSRLRVVHPVCSGAVVVVVVVGWVEAGAAANPEEHEAASSAQVTMPTAAPEWRRSAGGTAQITRAAKHFLRPESGHPSDRRHRGAHPITGGNSGGGEIRDLRRPFSGGTEKPCDTLESVGMSVANN
jgi:hypothetical protein